MTQQSQDNLALAKSLVDRLEHGDVDEANRIIAELTGFQDSFLFREVGRMARELHETIKSFLVDERIADLAKRDIPDAAERLTYVITMTEQAANQTLNAVEASLPLAERLGADASRLGEQWQRFNDRELTLAEFRACNAELRSFLASSSTDAASLQQNLNEVLMAQGFQDLTGQIIRRVITLVHDLETKLIDLLRIADQRAMLDKPDGESASPAAQAPAAAAETAVGPAVPGVDTGDLVSGQDDVDDLLSSLGF